MAGGGPFDRVLLVGVHLEQLAQPLLLALGRVDHLGTGFHDTGVHADVGQLAEERVHRDLERQRREGLVDRRLAADDLVFLAGHVTLHGLDVQRRRQVVDDRVEHGLHALVLERAAAQHRVQLAVDRQLADRALDLVDRELLATEVLLQQCLVALGDGLEQLGAVLLGLVGEVRGDVLDLVLLTEGGLAAPHLGLHLDQVDDADEVVLGTDRQLDHQRLGTEALLDGAHGEVEVRAELVHLVDEADTRHVVLVGLPPHLLGLRLHAFFAVEHGDRTVEHAQRALHLDGEVDVAGGVDDVDLVVVPEASHSRGGDGDTTLLLLLHPVGRGGTVVRLTDLVVDAGVVQDALGRRGLAGIDVRHDADVADLVQVGKHVLLCHRSLLSRFVDVWSLRRRQHCSPAAITSGSARRPGSPRPSCGCPHAA